MTEYRRDADGHLYAFGGLSDSGGTLDARRADRDAWDKLLERRAGELPQRRLTARQVDRIEYRLGWRADDVTGKVACPECGASNLPDSGFCCQCGNALVALEGDQGVQPGQTVTCPQCGHMDFPSDKYCVACGEPLPLSQASASSRPRRAAVRREQPAPSYGGRPTMLTARQTYDARDPVTGNIVHVIAGRTRIAAGCWLWKTRPFAYAA
jgi:hypothetical protein